MPVEWYPVNWTTSAKLMARSVSHLPSEIRAGDEALMFNLSEVLTNPCRRDPIVNDWRTIDGDGRNENRSSGSGSEEEGSRRNPVKLDLVIEERMAISEGGVEGGTGVVERSGCLLSEVSLEKSGGVVDIQPVTTETAIDQKIK